MRRLDHQQTPEPANVRLRTNDAYVLSDILIVAQAGLSHSFAIPIVEKAQMKTNTLRRLTALTLAVTAASSFAQTAPEGTVERSAVKTWVITVDGKDYEARPTTPTFSGTGGLFHLPSAYTLTKG